MILALTLLAVYANAQTACKFPSGDVAGYSFTLSDPVPNCNSDTCDAPTLTGLTCTAGYDGTPAVTQCTLGDEFVTVSGCDATQCTVPDTHTGYTMTAPAAGADVTGCMSSDSDSDCQALLTGLDCDAGYSGTAAAAACSTSDANVVLSGCTADPVPVQCVVPTVVPAGYTGMVADADVVGCTDLDCSSPTMTDFDCADGYTGTVAVAACSASDTSAVFSGCTEIPTQCTYPAAAQAGYTFTESDPITDCSVGACTTPTITATCDSGANYVGTVGIVAVCTDDAPAVVLNGCSIPVQCVVSDPLPAGYTGMVAGADVAGCTDVDCSSPTMTDFACADGYTGTVAVEACSSSDTSAVFSGCTEVQTTTEAPTDVTTTENTDDSALTVSVALAASIAMAMF